MKKLFSLMMALAMLLSVVSIAAAEDTLPVAEGTVLRMATGYNNSKTGLFFDPEIAGEGITLADGKAQLGDNCAMCLACLHFCPHQSMEVNGKVTLAERQYHHPEVELKDMIEF